MAREQRRLAASVAADVIRYSRLRGRDESGTDARLCQVRAERLAPVLVRRGGRIVKLAGEGEDLHGDGVNVAARLESEPLADGRVISGEMHNFRASRVAATFEDLGQLALENTGWESYDKADRTLIDESVRDRTRQGTFLRVSAGLERPSAAEALR
ncbi:MAG: hypothetical protein U1E60_23515 [Reyranellaceae bacterium]